MPTPVQVYHGPSIGMGWGAISQLFIGGVAEDGTLTGPKGWRANINSKGIIAVEHNLGHNRYFPIVSLTHGGAGSITVIETSGIAFTLKTFNKTGDLSSLPFNFLVGIA